MKEKLKEIMGDILDIPSSDINDNSSPENIPNWDSLNHMNLMVAIEEEFHISFSEEEMIDLTNFKILLNKIQEKAG